MVIYFKQTLSNKREIDTLYKGPYYFSPWNYGGSDDSDIIVLIEATELELKLYDCGFIWYNNNHYL